jgi:hypothetical protein
LLPAGQDPKTYYSNDYLAAHVADAPLQVAWNQPEKRSMSEQRKGGYTYADLHVGMSFRSSGKDDHRR